MSVPSGAPGSLLWQASSATVDEALNQREFEAARQAFLRGEPQPAPVQKKPARAKSGAPDRADILLRETRKMEEKLAVLRAATEKQKQLATPGKTAPPKPRSAAPSASPTRSSRTSAPPQSLVAATANAEPSFSTTVLASTLFAPKQQLPAANSGAYKHVGSRIDSKNVYLTTLESSQRQRLAAEAQSKAERLAESQRKAAEDARIARMRAAGHTIITYAAQPTPEEEEKTKGKWTIVHEEQTAAPAAPSKAAEMGLVGTPAHIGLSSSLGFGTAASTVGAARRKPITAADVMKSKERKQADAEQRRYTAGLQNESPPIQYSLQTRPSEATRLQDSGGAAAGFDFRSTQAGSEPSFLFSSDGEPNFLFADTAGSEQPKYSLSAGTETGTATDTGSSSGLLDGDFDEAANAVAFAAAREEFLTSLQGSSQAKAALPSGTGVGTETVASTSSLLNGEYDEAANADAFAAARAEFLASMKAEKKEEVKPQRQRQGEAVKPSPKASPNASPREPAASTSKKTVPATASGAAASTTAKQSCYNCYKLFLPGAGGGFFDAGDTNKHFCSPACAEATKAEMKVQCEQCKARVPRKHATKTGTARWKCSKCTATQSQAEEPEPSSLFGMDGLAASLDVMQPLSVAAELPSPDKGESSGVSGW
jgi:hypothetical protein